MKAAIILSTYNAPDRLQATLMGYAMQSRRDFELIVADDGSAEETRALICATARQFTLPIKHIWQEDIGFRKCRILNQAVLSTNADYLIFSDGDCIPRPDFVAIHMAAARPKRFLSGGYFKLTASTSARVHPEDIIRGRVTDVRWLKRNQTPVTHKLAKLAAGRWGAGILNALTPTRPTWNGHNASGWREDILRVNGFDERMAYWGQDREFGERLVNAGVRGIQIRYSAICVHLHHDRPYKTEQSRERNRQIRHETRTRRATWTEYGVVKSKAPPEKHALTPAPATDIAISNHQPA